MKRAWRSVLVLYAKQFGITVAIHPTKGLMKISGGTDKGKLLREFRETFAFRRKFMQEV